ncbi:hypothetical protein Aca07nite_27700 [Actinoplanes capillaceus]|uniref:Phospholipase D N-terminal domain-containing protein n=1 Tax=Actinoplanes campanulatus TaxID=113559 RepID=A0ABQ3WGX9_9ACTN|nr:PhoD-like phosphatase N-terminal domain-containing protein [Actinoplanes capillaceus]GID45495.1 hypothetical protein Aca07nite_27700 [Actinoplanes capillaceus]
MTRIDRRYFVLGGMTAAGSLVLPSSALAAVPNPFPLGVASGDPAATSVVLWTRLAVKPLNADGHGDGTPLTEIPYAGVNPHLRYFSERRGYTLVTLGRDRARADFRTLPVVTRRGARVATHASFITEAGRPGLHRL